MVKEKEQVKPRSEVFRSAAMEVKPGMGPADKVLLDEACRLLDRLDRFDELLAGDRDAWASVKWPYEGEPAELIVNSVLSEARAHTAELRQVLKALDLPVPKAAAGEKPSPLKVLLGGAAG